MQTQETLRLMAEVKNNIVEYLTEEIEMNSKALKSYENGDDPLKNKDIDAEIQRIREIEAIKLRDRIHELSRHIAVIKRMPL